MSGYRVVMLTVLLAFGDSVLSAQEQPVKPTAQQGSSVAPSEEEPSADTASRGVSVQEPQGWPDCHVGGIYRPFSLVRQLKLATAFFVDPTLPETAEIGHAYSLEQAQQSLGDDLIGMISRGEVLLAAPVENDVAGALSPVQWSVGDAGAQGTAALSPCRQLSHGESDDGVPQVGYVSGSPSTPEEWIENLSKEDLESFHVLFLGIDPLPDTDDSRFVTWDPKEGVGVSQPPKRERQ